tara:strand:+ start:124 stop:738 length:615 start_codon:yes stop_codon:yes gene_type:complete
MSHRRIEHLNDNRIIYRRLPVLDKPSHSFDWGYYFKDGTYEFYDLFRNRALINTYKSLMWHFRVLWFLNPNLTENKFKKLCLFISNKKNGFTTFDIEPHKIDSMVCDIRKSDLEEPPWNKLRKVIFKDYNNLTKVQKLKIIGSLVGRKRVTSEAIYEAMLTVNDEGHEITAKSLSKALDCSIRTIHRHMNNELKQEKNILNEKI